MTNPISGFFNRFRAQRIARYRFSYQVTVTQHGDETFQGRVIAPLPLQTAIQKVENSPQFDPRPQEQDEDPVFHNPYVAWDITLAPGEKKTIGYTCDLSTQPSSGVAETSDDFAPFLQPRPHLETTDARVVALADEIRSQGGDVRTQLERLNARIISQLVYGDPIDGLYRSTDCFTRKKVDCGGYGSLFVAATIVLGIPARIVCGFWAGRDAAMHAWVEARLPDGTWIPADPSVEQLRQQGRSQKIGEFGKIGSNRIALSRGCDMELVLQDGTRVTADILQHPVLVGGGEGTRISTTVSAERI